MDKNFRKQNYKEAGKLLAVLTHLGYIMITPVILSIVGGNWIDGQFNTSPLFLVLGVLLGVGASFKNLFDFMKKFGK